MISSVPQKLYRPTWAEVSLGAIEHNFRQVQKCARPGAKVLVALKADAYGHGAAMVAKRLIRCGVDYFGVATVDEAIQLRKEKIKKPLLLLTSCSPNDFQPLVRYAITPTIADYGVARALNEFLRRRRRRIAVHVKIDTGMGRIGVWYKEAFAFVCRLRQLTHLVLEGIYTHLPSADEDEQFTQTQLQVFCALIGSLEKEGVSFSLRHAANSAALMRYQNPQCNLLRPGIMIYGLYADASSQRYVDLRPALSFKTRIIFLKEISAGRSISYGRTFIAQRRMKIATLPVGYGDGYNRLLSNRGFVLIGGRRCPVVGRVCMDQTMVDVTKTKARLGSEAVLIGSQKNASITAEEIASLCSTISYEVVCNISKRVPRLYRR